MEKKHYIIKFVENTYTVSYSLDIAPQFIGSETFLVSTRKIEEFVKEHEFEYGYVEHLVDAALDQHARGFSPRMSTGRKYSFTDGGEDWYDALRPDEGCADELIEADVDVS